MQSIASVPASRLVCTRASRLISQSSCQTYAVVVITSMRRSSRGNNINNNNADITTTWNNYRHTKLGNRCYS